MAWLAAERLSSAADALFEDRVVAKGKGVEIKYSQVEEAVIAFKAGRAAAGERVSPDLEKEAEKTILDRLIATQVLMARATDEDRKLAKEIGEKFVDEAKSKAPSEEAFKRQLLAGGMTLAEFDTQVREQSLVKAVIDREMKPTHPVTDAQIDKFYAENPDAFQQPEQLRASHILFSFKEPITKADLSEEIIAEKKKTADKALARARAGEDFAKLVKEFSDDRAPDHPTGEYTFARGQMPPEFDAAAFTLATNQVSDVVTTRFGYHIIKLHERIPAKKSELDASAREKVREKLQQMAIQADLAGFIENLKKEADIIITLNEKK